MSSHAAPRIDEGSINFWIKPNQMDYADGRATPLVQINPTGGSVLIVKDSDNLIKFFHVYIGKGRTDVVYDVSKLNPSQPHMFTATWSVSAGEANIYIDGQLAATSSIPYTQES